MQYFLSVPATFSFMAQTVRTVLLKKTRSNFCFIEAIAAIGHSTGKPPRVFFCRDLNPMISIYETDLDYIYIYACCPEALAAANRYTCMPQTFGWYNEWLLAFIPIPGFLIQCIKICRMRPESMLIAPVSIAWI